MDGISEIDRIVIEQHIAKLICRFYALYDSHQYDEVLAMYAEDVRFGSAMRPGQGRDQIAASLANRPGTVLTRHIITNLAVEVTGPDTASATGTVTGYLNMNAFPLTAPVPFEGAPTVADSRLGFRKVDGRWLISENLGQPVFAAPRG